MESQIESPYFLFRQYVLHHPSTVLDNSFTISEHRLAFFNMGVISLKTIPFLGNQFKALTLFLISLIILKPRIILWLGKVQF